MSVWKFGDYVDTDQILPGPYLSISDPAELSKHLFENIRPEMPKGVKTGDIIVAGKYFGCGSSREHAVLAIKGAGISCVIAESFSRIFFRNAVNLGLEIILIDDASMFDENDKIEIDKNGGKIINSTNGHVCEYKVMPEFLERIIKSGGLIPYAQKYLTRGDNTMEQRYSKVPCSIIRGGTSKGVFFYEDDVPPAGSQRDSFLCAVMGSPDPRQIDGLGGADSLTSKVAIIKKSARAEADIDYTFAQVSVETATVDYNANCGNITAGAGLFAVEEGLVIPKEPTAQVRIYNTNTGKILRVEVPCENSAAARSGDYKIDGVPGGGPKFKLDFSDTVGAVSGQLFPTGNRIDIIDVSGLGAVEVSIVDIANPVVFVRASDLGLKGNESPNDISAKTGLLSQIEQIRGIAAQKIGLVDNWERARISSPAIPLLSFVSPPGDELASLTARVIFMQSMHKTYSGAAAVCTAVASKIPGTIPHLYARHELGDFVIAHPAGHMAVEIDVKTQGDKVSVNKAAFGRTARRIMDGFVYAY